METYNKSKNIRLFQSENALNELKTKLMTEINEILIIPISQDSDSIPEVEIGIIKKSFFFPTGASQGEAEIFLESALDSLRISFKFNINQPNLKLALKKLLRKLTDDIQTLNCHKIRTPCYESISINSEFSQCTLPDGMNELLNTKKKESKKKKTDFLSDDDIHFYNHLEPVLFGPLIKNFERIHEKYFIRKKPLSGYDLSFLLQYPDLQKTSPKNTIKKIIDFLDELGNSLTLITDLQIKKISELASVYCRNFFI